MDIIYGSNLNKLNNFQLLSIISWLAIEFHCVRFQIDIYKNCFDSIKIEQ